MALTDRLPALETPGDALRRALAALLPRRRRARTRPCRPPQTRAERERLHRLAERIRQHTPGLP